MLANLEGGGGGFLLEVLGVHVFCSTKHSLTQIC